MAPTIERSHAAKAVTFTWSEGAPAATYPTEMDIDTDYLPVDADACNDCKPVDHSKTGESDLSTTSSGDYGDPMDIDPPEEPAPVELDASTCIECLPVELDVPTLVERDTLSGRAVLDGLFEDQLLDQMMEKLTKTFGSDKMKFRKLLKQKLREASGCEVTIIII